MTDYTWPEDLAPYVQAFWLQPHVGRSESPFTRQQKVYGLSAPRWITRMGFRGGYDNLGGLRDLGGRLDALLAKLGGGVNRALVYDFRRSTRTGTAGPISDFDGDTVTFDQGETFDEGEVFEFIYPDPPSSLAALAGGTGMTWVGFHPYGLVFKAGDYVGGDGRVHIVTDDAYANGAGVVTINFLPALESAVPVAAAIFEKVTSPFRLTDDDAGSNSTEVGQPVSYDLTMIEDL